MHTPEDELDPQGAVDRVVRKTPWWSLSLGIHIVAVLLMGFFWVVQAEEEIEAVVVQPPRKPKEVVMDPRIDRDPTKNPLDLPKTSEESLLVKSPSEESETLSTDVESVDRPQGDPEFVSDKPFKGRGTYDVSGGNHGGGGKFGTRGRGKTGCTRIGGGGPETEDAVLSALRWLARHQNPDGSWNVQGYVGRCKETCSPNPGHGDFDAGVTGLSLLAFLGAGYSHLSKDTYDGICFGDVVRQAIRWMQGRQDPEGCIGDRSAQKYMYSHTICALALAEAYGLTGSSLFKDSAQKSIDFLVQAQNPGKGWRYSYKCGDNDSSVTGWAVMALKSAELSGLQFPQSAYAGSRAWLDEATEASYGRVGYTQANTGTVYIQGMNEQFSHHEALTAIGVMSRLFMDKNKSDPRLSSGCELLLRDKPRFDGNATDFYYWYYASLALFQFDGPKGPKWRSWNEDMKTALVKNQNVASSGCRRGSWEPVDRWSCEGGRIYGTAINALTLEVYYRYANVIGRNGY